jgi:hypothetical protein
VLLATVCTSTALLRQFVCLTMHLRNQFCRCTAGAGTSHDGGHATLGGAPGGNKVPSALKPNGENGTAVRPFAHPNFAAGATGIPGVDGGISQSGMSDDQDEQLVYQAAVADKSSEYQIYCDQNSSAGPDAAAGLLNSAVDRTRWLACVDIMHMHGRCDHMLLKGSPGHVRSTRHSNVSFGSILPAQASSVHGNRQVKHAS